MIQPKFDDSEQAKAIKALVKENEILTRIKDNLLKRIQSVHNYNVMMNHKQPTTERLEEELKKIMNIPGAIPEVKS